MRKWGIFIVSCLGVGSKELEGLFWNNSPMFKETCLILTLSLRAGGQNSGSLRAGHVGFDV